MTIYKPQVYANPSEVAAAAAQIFLKLTATAVEQRGVCRIALAGGSSPKMMHTFLTKPPFKDKVPWENLEIFWGDERYVPMNDPESNYHMAQETLLSHVPIPHQQIYPMPVILKPEEGAEQYIETLAYAFKNPPSTPVFDLILLGLGPDGHTASLFPNHPLLKEDKKWVGPIFDSPKPPPQRLTLTLPIINAARHILFLVTGKSKANALQAIFQKVPLKTTDLPEGYHPPASLVNPLQGDLQWLVDETAMSFDLD